MYYNPRDKPYPLHLAHLHTKPTTTIKGEHHNGYSYR